MQKWEYLVIATERASSYPLYSDGFTPKQLETRPAIWDVLNELGNEGWELVSGEAGHLFYLKRPK